MRLSGYQPQYFPRLHYIQRALESDIFEISDYLQFVRKHDFPTPDGGKKRGKSYQAHTVVKLITGPHFLVVPAVDHLEPINRTQIVYKSDWIRVHLETLKTAYSRAAYFPRFFPELESILKFRYLNLGDLNITGFLWSVGRFITDDALPALTVGNINILLKKYRHPFRLKNIVLVSETGVAAPSGNSNRWLVDLCQKLGANEYVTGETALTAYMEPAIFAKAGIKVTTQKWICRQYNQLYPQAGFLANLSAIDLIMNTDLDTRRDIMKSYA